MSGDRDAMQRLLDGLDYATELSEQRDEHRRELTSLLLAVLDVRDSFDRLLEQGCDDEPPLVGTCRLIARQLDTALERAGVRALDAVGAVVSPHRHEVVAVRTGPAAQDDVVLEVVRRGYEWRGSLLRPAQVIIGKSGEEGSA